MMDLVNKIKIIKDFEWYYKNGYITTRDGNACFVKEDGNFMITASGVPKHEIDRESFVTVNYNGTIICAEHQDSAPSIETAAHLHALIQTEKKASVHVHSPNTVALFGLFQSSQEQQDLIGCITTKWPEFFRYTILGDVIRYDTPGSMMLHDNIELAFTGPKKTDIVVLDRHGVLAVGDTLEQCREHCERLEHTCSMILKMLMANGGKRDGII
jgi:ribulose-5-phosphate 4-epimerase/fuculose-1-phosphate aldolase